MPRRRGCEQFLWGKGRLHRGALNARPQRQGDSPIIDDEVAYQLPLFPLGEIGYPLVRWQLARIFKYRQRVVREALLR